MDRQVGAAVTGSDEVGVDGRPIRLSDEFTLAVAQDCRKEAPVMSLLHASVHRLGLEGLL